MTEIIKEYHHKEDGVSVIVAKIDKGFSVTLKDTDCGEYLGICHIYNNLNDAINKAVGINKGFL